MTPKFAWVKYVHVVHEIQIALQYKHLQGFRGI